MDFPSEFIVSSNYKISPLIGFRWFQIFLEASGDFLGRNFALNSSRNTRVPHNFGIRELCFSEFLAENVTPPGDNSRESKLKFPLSCGTNCVATGHNQLEIWTIVPGTQNHEVSRYVP